MVEKKDYFVQDGMLPGQFVEACEEIKRVKLLSPELAACLESEIARARAQSPFAQLKIRREEGMVFNCWELGMSIPLSEEGV